MNEIEIIEGDVITGLATIPSGSVHCVVTSPPYYGLRNYLQAGDPLKRFEMGRERTPEEYVERMVGVFGEVRRVLRDDGTCWLNMGDSYSYGPRRNGARDVSRSGTSCDSKRAVAASGQPKCFCRGLKAGDLMGMAWRLAFALQADGWFLRMDVVWEKPNPLPESVNGWRWERHKIKVGPGKKASTEKKSQSTPGRPHGARASDGYNFDSRAKWEECPGCKQCEGNGGLVLRRGRWRPTRAHEYIFMLAKSRRYFCDAEGVQEAGSPKTLRMHMTSYKGHGDEDTGSKLNRWMEENGGRYTSGRRNPRSVWWMTTEGFHGKHYAIFPTALPDRCIRAGTSERGVCPTCGAPWARVLENSIAGTGERTAETRRIRWRATCPCPGEYAKASGICDAQPPAGEWLELVDKTAPLFAPIPATVLDPFCGAGTTLLVAARLGRRGIGIELNPKYVRMARKRIRADAPLLYWESMEAVVDAEEDEGGCLVEINENLEEFEEEEETGESDE